MRLLLLHAAARRWLTVSDRRPVGVFESFSINLHWLGVTCKVKIPIHDSDEKASANEVTNQSGNETLPDIEADRKARRANPDTHRLQRRLV